MGNSQGKNLGNPSSIPLPRGSHEQGDEERTLSHKYKRPIDPSAINIAALSPRVDISDVSKEQAWLPINQFRQRNTENMRCCTLVRPQLIDLSEEMFRKCTIHEDTVGEDAHSLRLTHGVKNEVKLTIMTPSCSPDRSRFDFKTDEGANAVHLPIKASEDGLGEWKCMIKKTFSNRHTPSDLTSDTG